MAGDGEGWIQLQMTHLTQVIFTFFKNVREIFFLKTPKQFLPL